MFGGFFGNALKIAPKHNPLGGGQAPMAPTQYQAPAQPMQSQFQAQSQAPAAPQMPAGQGFARTANGPIPMGAKGDCQICH
jgi:hypothetical protein